MDELFDAESPLDGDVYDSYGDSGGMMMHQHQSTAVEADDAFGSFHEVVAPTTPVAAAASSPSFQSTSSLFHQRKHQLADSSLYSNIGMYHNHGAESNITTSYIDSGLLHSYQEAMKQASLYQKTLFAKQQINERLQQQQQQQQHSHQLMMSSRIHNPCDNVYANMMVALPSQQDHHQQPMSSNVQESLSDMNVKCPPKEEHHFVDPIQQNPSRRSIVPPKALVSSNQYSIPHPTTLSETNHRPPPTSHNPYNITSLALPADSDFLDPLHNYLRSVCIEIFTATEGHLKPPGKGARPSKVGQVGIRCVFCRHLPPKEVANQAICFPSRKEGIFEGIRNFQRVHVDACAHISDSVKERYNNVTVQSKSCKKRNQKAVRAYYAQAATELGLVDTTRGMVFGTPPNISGKPSKELLDIINAANDPTTSSSFWDSRLTSNGIDKATSMGKFESAASPATREVILNARREGTPIVYPQDFATTTDLLYLLFHQLAPCKPTYANIKRRHLTPEQCESMSGLCCKHCAFKSESNFRGFYFPIDADALADSSFTQTLSVHLIGCSNTPQVIKDAMEELKSLAKDHNVIMKRGSKRKFLEKVWGRMCSYYGKATTETPGEENSVLQKEKTVKKQDRRCSAPTPLHAANVINPVAGLSKEGPMRRLSQVDNMRWHDDRTSLGILMREPLMCFSPGSVDGDAIEAKAIGVSEALV
ncbi:predicted protein [Thalassiosira pseudonana CCMP1335]|uniref:Uncharacterized protein n=1 Tax=Thalassiosira pseudonana TaxID=35128 RepID=B8C7W9_THAPS|nr:predicted protein [Thalassiosira pseudonana CCMP1335]EED90183.1 predicted protein [Thalassiosira pseudonana CCMP1335]|eukprot:scaffold114_cov200-Alexandrium_tamarense.AAC.48